MLSNINSMNGFEPLIRNQRSSRGIGAGRAGLPRTCPPVSARPYPPSGPARPFRRPLRCDCPTPAKNRESFVALAIRAGAGPVQGAGSGAGRKGAGAA